MISNSDMVFSFAIGTIILGLAAVAYGCVLLSRGASIAIELATQSTGLADALCVAGDRVERLEKMISLLVPETKHFSSAEILSEKERELIVELVKKLK
ncbi:MAG: hypothetical protein WC637_02700 [Victivallales bacterium]